MINNNKNYNIHYNINERLTFLQNKYKDYDIKISNCNNKLIKSRKKGNTNFQPCCINFDCIKQPNFAIQGQKIPTHCKDCSLLDECEMKNIVNKYIKKNIYINLLYDINDRLKFLQNKYKDYHFKISKNIFIYCKKQNNKQYRKCCLDYNCITIPCFAIKGNTFPTHCNNCKLSNMINILQNNR
jgi:hypothetical protein